MSEVIALPERGFRYLRGVFQYSAAIAALPGWRIERARFLRPPPLADGFTRIEAHLASLGLPPAAFAACELRSPAPFSQDGFDAFNRAYFGVLERWGVPAGGDNPIARANVCPEIAPPPTPSFYAFSYARPDPAAAPSFVIAGSGETEEGRGPYRDHTVALGDTSPAGLRAKAGHVLGVMERRMAALGFGWADTTAAQIYTVHDIAPFYAEAIVARGADGAAWQYCRPPVVDLEFEMDCRSVCHELVLD